MISLGDDDEPGMKIPGGRIIVAVLPEITTTVGSFAVAVNTILLVIFEWNGIRTGLPVMLPQKCSKIVCGFDTEAPRAGTERVRKGSASTVETTAQNTAKITTPIDTGSARGRSMIIAAAAARLGTIRRLQVFNLLPNSEMRNSIIFIGLES